MEAGSETPIKMGQKQQETQAKWRTSHESGVINHPRRVQDLLQQGPGDHSHAAAGKTGEKIAAHMQFESDRLDAQHVALARTVEVEQHKTTSLEADQKELREQILKQQEALSMAEKAPASHPDDLPLIISSYIVTPAVVNISSQLWTCTTISLMLARDELLSRWIKVLLRMFRKIQRIGFSSWQETSTSLPLVRGYPDVWKMGPRLVLGTSATTLGARRRFFGNSSNAAATISPGSVVLATRSSLTLTAFMWAGHHGLSDSCKQLPPRCGQSPRLKHSH
jgi:hypothetical protein